MSIRLRLTLLYSAILALTLIAFSAVLYTIQSQYTLNIVKGDLSNNARRLATLLAHPERDMDRRSPFPRVPWWEAAQGDRTPLFPQPLELRELQGRDMVRLLGADGASLDMTVNQESEDLPLSAEGLEQLLHGQPWIEIAHGEEGRVLIYNEPVGADGETVAIVQFARSLADRDRGLRALGFALILGSLLTTVVAFGIGWFLAGVTLRPIHRITQAALEIGQTRDFSSRVQYKGPHDELGRLATTLNGMLSRLQDAYQQVAHSLQVQRDFVADVSHELRTPLTTIRGNLALLHHDPPLPRTEREDALEDLIGESERLIRLVSDLLTLARADAGRKLACERVAIQPLVDDVCRQARLLEPEREIQVDGPGDLVALADCDALKQVLLTLLDNAVKHGDGAIRVVLGECEHQVTIEVQDNGPGMSPELCERIFDRFYRADESRSTPGFGLGLAIAKALAEAQQGTITVKSQIGEGSTFMVRLPKPPQS